MKRVLLTGAKGFVGSHVFDYLSSHTDWEIIVPRVDLAGDFKSAKSYDYIVNIASKASVEDSVKHPAEYIKNNVDLMINLLEYARKRPPQVFLHLSTVEVYNVTNPYAASKAAQEEIANAYWKTYGVPMVILRATNIIGSQQTDESMFLPRIIKQIKAGETVKIYTANGEIGVRRYNPVVNIADAILYLLNQYPNKYENTNPEAYPTHWNIDGLELTDNLTMAQKVASLLGKELKYELFEPTAIRPTYTKYLISGGANLQDYGWTPPVTLHEGLQWIKQM